MVKLLIVDDEASVRDALSAILQPLGHKIVCAPCGDDALDRAKKEFFDIIFLDIAIQDTNSLRLMEDLRKTNPNIRCVMLLSNESDFNTALAAIKRGAFNSLSKPFKGDEVTQVVNDALKAMLGPDAKRFNH